jgi:hypothetical protein
MAKRLKDIKEIRIERPPGAKLSAEESLGRTQEFEKRREKFIASPTVPSSCWASRSSLLGLVLV